jgi:hypothetical protein
MIAAFSGTTIERNTATSNRKLSPITTTRSVGRRSALASEKSTMPAVNPPM